MAKKKTVKTKKPVKTKKSAVKKTKVAVAKKAKVKTSAKKSVAAKKANASKAAKQIVKALVKKQSEVSFYPLADRVLIEQSDGYSKTDGGLFIPDAYQEKPLEGKVLRVGPGFRSKKGLLRPIDIKAGDRVMFTKYAGSKIQLDGQNYLILSEADIIGVVTK